MTRIENRKINRVGSSLFPNNGPHSIVFCLAHTSACIWNLCSKQSMFGGYSREIWSVAREPVNDE